MPYVEKKKHISPEQNPLISIITPLYNAENFIAETIISIQNQTYSNWEVLIVDDCSTDLSSQVVEKLELTDSRIHFIRNDVNKGASDCRNQGAGLAKGEYIAFLDADDLWHSEKLEKQLQFMQANNCDVSFTSYVHIDEDSEPINKRIKALASLSYKKQHSNNYIGNLTGMYKTSALGKISSPSMRKRQDWALWLEAIKRSKKPALGLQEDLAYYRIHKGSMSGNKLALVIHNFSFYRLHLGHSRIASAFYLIRFFWEYFLIRPKQIEKW
ncbi:MAG: teichuronic acid biosynthesis glycosyltransferase TuaG [Ulvibacter sp.]|jgi:glycosyltransferase involved in cell wall biosynthesis